MPWAFLMMSGVIEVLEMPGMLIASHITMALQGMPSFEQIFFEYSDAEIDEGIDGLGRHIVYLLEILLQVELFLHERVDESDQAL